MKLKHALTSFIRHFFWAKGDLLLHSPFVYQLYRSCIRSHGKPHEFNAIESLRSALLKDDTVLKGKDPGTGGQHTREIKDVARYHLSAKKESLFHYHLGVYINAKTVLELGTSLGINTAYLSLFANHVHTIEGHEGTAAQALKNFSHLDRKNIALHQGAISEQLPRVLEATGLVDFLLLDAHHALEPTLTYFETCLPYLHNDSAVVVDDIYWSEGMTTAWETLKSHPKVTLSLDFYHFGVLFFRKEQVKQHFRLYLSPLL